MKTRAAYISNPPPVDPQALAGSVADSEGRQGFAVRLVRAGVPWNEHLGRVEAPNGRHLSGGPWSNSGPSRRDHPNLEILQAGWEPRAPVTSCAVGPDTAPHTRSTSVPHHEADSSATRAPHALKSRPSASIHLYIRRGQIRVSHYRDLFLPLVEPNWSQTTVLGAGSRG